MSSRSSSPAAAFRLLLLLSIAVLCFAGVATHTPARQPPTTTTNSNAGAPARRNREVRLSSCNPLQPLRSATHSVLKSDAARHLIAGAMAGVVSNTIVAPLDILRINLMVSKQTTNPLLVAKKLYAQGGILAFWQGNAADVMRTIPASAVRFYSFAVYKAQLPFSGTAGNSLFAGGLAGMTAMALLFPLETVRTQMATAGALGGTSVFAFARNIVAKQGATGLYRGLPASLISVMPYFGVRFGMYDILRRWHLTMARAAAGEADGGSSAPITIPSQASAAYGFSAGLAASALTFPMEVVRRRAMVGAVSSNFFVSIPAIIGAEGVAGLYKGYFVNVVKVAPASAITFLTYERVRGVLDRLVVLTAPPEPKPALIKRH